MITYSEIKAAEERCTKYVRWKSMPSELMGEMPEVSDFDWALTDLAWQIRTELFEDLREVLFEFREELRVQEHRLCALEVNDEDLFRSIDDIAREIHQAREVYGVEFSEMQPRRLVK